jgi:hypothetical protein
MIIMIMELGSRRVWSINRGCLLLLGTWSHLRYIRGSVLDQLFLWLVIPTCFSRLITLWYLNHFMQKTVLKHYEWLLMVINLNTNLNELRYLSNEIVQLCMAHEIEGKQWAARDGRRGHYKCQSSQSIIYTYNQSFFLYHKHLFCQYFLYVLRYWEKHLDRNWNFLNFTFLIGPH